MSNINDYSAELADGREIFIPSWSVSVQFENLTQACKYLGQNYVEEISANINVPAAMVAIMGSDDAKAASKLVMHFVQQARIEGKKINLGEIDELGMDTVIELFAHVLHSQYSRFFASGIAKVISPQE